TGGGSGKSHLDAVGARKVKLDALLLSMVMKCEAVPCECVACDIASAHLGTFTKTIEEYSSLCLCSHISYIGIIVVEDGYALWSKHPGQFAFGESHTFL